MRGKLQRCCINNGSMRSLNFCNGTGSSFTKKGKQVLNGLSLLLLKID